MTRALAVSAFAAACMFSGCKKSQPAPAPAPAAAPAPAPATATATADTAMTMDSTKTMVDSTMQMPADSSK